VWSPCVGAVATDPSNASVQPKKHSNEFYGWDIRFKKTDGEAREGGVVENLSAEFDPGSD
jgi:hypothetical protein